MSALHHYFPLFRQIRNKLSWKKFALVTSEIFLLFVNTLTPDEKCSRRNMQFFWQQLQTLLSQEEKTFRGFFMALPKCAWNLEHSQKNKSILAELLPKLIHPKEIFTLASKRSWIRTPFVNQRVNGFEALLKLAPHHYFSISRNSI